MSNSARFLWPIPGRLIIAGCMLIIAGGRFGLYQHTDGRLLTDRSYAILFLISGFALIVTQGKGSLHWYGRITAALSAGLLATLGLDLLAATHGNTTPSMIMLWLATVLVVQAGARREC